MAGAKESMDKLRGYDAMFPASQSTLRESSKHFGVRFRPDLQKWVAEIKVAEWKTVHKKLWLGTFYSEEGAARAVDAARKLLKCKKKRPPNFPCKQLHTYTESIPSTLNLNNLQDDLMFKEVSLFVKHKGQEYAASFTSTKASASPCPSPIYDKVTGTSSIEWPEFHVIRWIPSVQATLQHLCIVDYGQQAIMRRTSILKILSQNCKVLKSLDLRNMFIDSAELEAMPMMRSFTMRCVKVTGDTLQLVNTYMPNLTTLVLLGAFGVTHGSLDFPMMKVLCLGLSTMAKDVSIRLPSLEKLQLKMQCPENLTISAAGLKFMAFNLEVRDTSKVDLKNVSPLQELLYGTSPFNSLSSLVAANVHLEKVFLDIPCMVLGEDGKWLGVLKDIPFNVPSFNKLLLCQKLAVLNIGPGLWHSMEVNVEQLAKVEKWPPLKRLILHMIPQNLDSCLATLHVLLKPTLASLEIFVHTNSPISYEAIVPKVAEIVSHRFGLAFAFKPRHWTRSLDFSCFSF